MVEPACARDVPAPQFAPDPRLVAEGWERRFTAEPARAREAAQLYAELGFDVRVEMMSPAEAGPACGDCGLAVCRAYVTIYTRRAVEAASAGSREP